ncbi:MAG: hypothetical protein ACYTXE_36275 [Nostoc sp.]
MSKFYNNVKSRLNKKGIKGLTKTDYLLAAEYLGIEDLDKATTEQIIAGVDYLMGKQSTQLVSPVQSEEIISLDNAESEENIPNSEVFQSITPLEDIETESYEELEDEEVTAMPAAVNYAPLDIDQAGELATVEDKSELVASTAQSMGIELQLSEIQNIASNMDCSGDSLGESIADIRAAITTFVEYKAQVNQQKINHMITEVRATVTQRNKETSQRLNNGLSQIANDIKEADTDFKSQVKSALQCFAIPANKTS